MHDSNPRLSRRLLLGALALAAVAPWREAVAQGAFDHSHAAWTPLLKKHVAVREGGRSSGVRYGALAGDRAALKAYLEALSAVPKAAFDGWSKPQQMAFLINAYNGFTIELILTKYPNLKSIKDLGSLITSPWKPKWIALLGDKVSLDNIEHDMLRARGRFDDPRVHFAVNCASIGCPMLREEAFVPERLDAQLDEQARRFMGDRSRNRWNKGAGKLEISKIFDWFGEDFKLGHKGIGSVGAFCARYADQLADDAADRERIRGAQAPIDFLDYDWSLNDAK
jgi:hypothetical protein